MYKNRNRGEFFSRQRKPQQVGVTEPKWTPRKKQHHNYTKRRAIYHRIVNWVDNQDLIWTSGPPEVGHDGNVFTLETRKMVAKIRHEMTNYDLLKEAIEPMVARDICPYCYARPYCQDTFTTQCAMLDACQFCRLARSKLFERATRKVLNHLGLEWGDGLVWREGTLGAMVATWEHGLIWDSEEGPDLSKYYGHRERLGSEGVIV